jgi:nitrogenase molybdenum-iron protein alpha/beta subunit
VHHNFSLFHSTFIAHPSGVLPEIIASNLSETDIVFGGEAALSRTLTSVAVPPTRAVFVLSTCIADTIGDDTEAICGQKYQVPVIHVPTAGFIGGNFQQGVNNALIALAALAEPSPQPGSGVNIIGEMNLEDEAEENFAEVHRILSSLGIPVNARFVRGCTYGKIAALGRARVNILRDESLVPVGEALYRKFGIPYVDSFPFGLEGTIGFMQKLAGLYGIPAGSAIQKEEEFQEQVLAGFSDIAGSVIAGNIPETCDQAAVFAHEVASRLDIKLDRSGRSVPLLVSPPVGTRGIRRLLHRWRRAIHA